MLSKQEEEVFVGGSIVFELKKMDKTMGVGYLLILLDWCTILCTMFTKSASQTWWDWLQQQQQQKANSRCGCMVGHCYWRGCAYALLCSNIFAHIKHFITCRFTALFSTTSRRQWFEVLCKMCHCVSMMTYVFVSVCVWLWEEIWLWFLQIDYSNSFIPSDYKRIPVLNFLSLELNSIPTQSRQRRKTRNHLFPVVKLIISTHCYYC